MKLIKMITVCLSALFLFSCAQATVNAEQEIKLSQIQQNWQLAAINGQKIDDKIVSTLTFSSPEQATGQLACNRFFGTIKLSDNKLKIEEMRRTRKKCTGVANNIEQRVGSILSNWSDVIVMDSQLTLITKKWQLHYISKP